jgi:pyrroline-5-carboxylate reductase
MTNKHIQTPRVAFLGAGIIAGVFIERMLNAQVTTPDNILATDPKEERLKELGDRFGIRTSPDNRTGADFGDLLFLAMPPAVVKAVLSESCQAVHENQIIVSLAAAVPTWLIESVLCKPVPVVRVIPNIPSLIGAGVNPYTLGKHVSQDQAAIVENLLRVFGSAIRFEERDMNAATALTAVGPAYIFPVLHALASAAEAKGIRREQALTMTADLVAGTARLVRETGREPEDLRLMIGTRALNEQQTVSLFSSAFTLAFEKISASERKLTQ